MCENCTSCSLAESLEALASCAWHPRHSVIRVNAAVRQLERTRFLKMNICTSSYSTHCDRQMYRHTTLIKLPSNVGCCVHRLLSGNQFCCDEEVLWLRNYSSCIDTDQPCYPSTGDTRKCTLFTFQLRGLCSCNAISDVHVKLKQPLTLNCYLCRKLQKF